MNRCDYDWGKIISDILKAGYTPKNLSMETGSTPKQLIKIQSNQGRKPDYATGNALLNIWTRSYIPTIYPRKKTAKVKANKASLESEPIQWI